MRANPTLRELAVFIYGEEPGTAVAEQLEDLLARYGTETTGGGVAPASTLGPLSEKDVVVITYGDQITSSHRNPLRTLHEFLNRWAAEVVNCVHILPFFPFTSDDGFSVSDYLTVNPELGDWDDVAALGQDFVLMFDAVINHVSSQHEWFRGFLAGDPTYREYFIDVAEGTDLSSIVRPRTTPLLTDFETASGTARVWTTFSADQVDLNYGNPKVLLAVTEVLFHYVAHGAKLIRLDAVTFLWKEPGTNGLHHPKTHAIIKLLRHLLGRAAPHVVLITETNVPHQENIGYFGNGHDEAHMVYNFALPPLVLHALSKGDATTLSGWAREISTPSEETFFFNYLASHDGIGLRAAEGILDQTELDDLAEVSLAHGGYVSYMVDGSGKKRPYELNINFFDALNDPRSEEAQDLQAARFICAHAIMLALAGVPGIYFHSLVGSRGDLAGAARTGQPRSINREKLRLTKLEEELQDSMSLRRTIYDGLARLIRARRGNAVFHPAAPQRVLETPQGVFGLERTDHDGVTKAVCLHNLTNVPQDVPVIMGSVYEMTSLPSPAKRILDGQGDGRTVVRLPPYGVCWLTGAS